MDAKIVSPAPGSVLTGYSAWDFDVDMTEQIVPMITGDEEDLQAAEVAAALILDSIPQLPGVGVDWVGFTGGTTSFATIDAQIRQMLNDAGQEDFYPTYDIVNGLLSVTVSKSTA
jgi:hypothetical protein